MMSHHANNMFQKGHRRRHQGKVRKLYINGDSRDIFRDSELGVGLGGLKGVPCPWGSLKIPLNIE